MAERADDPRTAHRPWLFYRDGIDWTWLSYRRAARAVREGSEGRATIAASSGDRGRGPLRFHWDDVVELLSSSEWPDEVETRSDRLRAALPALDGLRHRCVVYADASLGPSWLPVLADLTLELEGAGRDTAGRDAAWVLEPQVDAFVATATWVRPTVVVATAPWLDRLAAAWTAQVRRWSRLEAVVCADLPASADSELELERRDAWSERFARPVVPFSLRA